MAYVLGYPSGSVEDMSLFEIVPLVVSIFTGLGSLVLAVLVFGRRRKGTHDAKGHQRRIAKNQADRYKAELERWRTCGDLVIDDETWNKLMVAGESDPEAYLRVYKAIHPHVKQLRAIRNMQSHYSYDKPIKLSTARQVQDIRSRRATEGSGFFVEAPVPL